MRNEPIIKWREKEKFEPRSLWKHDIDNANFNFDINNSYQFLYYFDS